MSEELLDATVDFSDDGRDYDSDGVQLPTLHPSVPKRCIPINDPEEWTSEWTEELVTLYHSVVDQAAGAGWPLLDACTFAQFVEFVFKHSSRLPPAV